MKKILDCWLISADFIKDEKNDLYHANLAGLAALKDLYLLDTPNWAEYRDKVWVGIIKEEEKYGTSSVSMGVAVEYFKANPTATKVLILNCGTGGTKYGLFTNSPHIFEVSNQKDLKDAQISCIVIPGVGYNPSSYLLPFSRTVAEVQNAVAADEAKAIEDFRKKGLWEDNIESLAFITGSIRDHYFKTPKDQVAMDSALNGLFKSIGVKQQSSFFLDQRREGELELRAVQAMHANLETVGLISKGIVPIVSLGIGRGSTQWAMQGEVIVHDAGMNSISKLAKLGNKIIGKLRCGETWNTFCRSVKEQIDKGNKPVIALKSGCTLAFLKKNVPNGDEQKEKFLNAISPPESPSMRLFLAQNSNPDLERMTWTKPDSVRTLDSLCAHASVVLKTKANFIAVYHENGCRIRELENIRDGDLLFFSQGEYFGAPPGLPTTAEKMNGLRCVPLSWIPDRWLIGQDTDHELDQVDQKYTHATMATLNELWHFGTPEWNEVREKVQVCFQEDLDQFRSEATIREVCKNEMTEDSKKGDEEKSVQRKIAERQKFVKYNLLDTLNITPEGNLQLFGLEKPHSEFPKEFVAHVRRNGEGTFGAKLGTMRSALLPFIVLSRSSLPLLYQLENPDNSRVITKRNEYRTQLRDSLAKAIHKPVIEPPNIRVYFGINSEKDGSACRVSPEWTLSRICAEAVQVLCPGESGILFTRVFNKMGFEILPENVLTPIGIKEEDTLLFSLGEDFNEEVTGEVAKCTIPAIVSFSLRKMSDVDIATGRITIVFDFSLLVPREGVPKEVRRDGFLAQPIRATLNQEEFSLSNPISVAVSQDPPSSISHITSHTNKPTQFFKWKSRQQINTALNSSDDLLHDAIRACPFDAHILHFVTELKPVRTRAYKVAFNIHFMKKACEVRDKEKVDYLPEFDVNWETARVELATRVPIGIERNQWTEELEDQELLCVGQEEMMHGVQNKDPKWMDEINGDSAYFRAGTGCDCTFQDFSLSHNSAPPLFSNFVLCPKKLILDLRDTNEKCRVQGARAAKHISANAFSVLHYSVLIRRDPTLLTLLAVVPVFLLCLLALAIVWQSDGFTDSVANIAAVLLALFAYSPVVRSKLPPSPSITSIDKLLDYAVFVCFWVLVTAVIQEAVRQNYEVRDDNLNDVIVDGVVAKLYLARVSLVSSMIIVFGHILVFSYFAYKVLQFRVLSKRQTDYLRNADRASAAVPLRGDRPRPALEFKHEAVELAGYTRMPSGTIDI